MAGAKLAEVVAFLDDYLDMAGVPDAANALNGLQVENSGRVSRAAVAVDASERTVVAAAAAGCDLLIVHHGLFWGGLERATGRRYRKLRSIMAADMAVYSAHLPLDVHDTIGNNVVLARELGIRVEGRFGEYNGVLAGVWGRLGVKREVLAARLDDVLGCRVHMMAFGPEAVHTVGVVTGGAGSMIGAAVKAGLDAFVTGEGAHHTHFDAEEGGINVYYGGHYATETWGVREVGALLETQFQLPWQFIDHPTGL